MHTVVASPSTLRVLVADDYPLLRQGLRSALVAAGMDVVAEADDGEEAVRLADALRPDVVLLDVAMPRMDGLAAAAHIRRRHPRMAVLMLTGHDDPALLRAALEAGASGYVLKGIAAEAVVAGVRAVQAGAALVDGRLLRAALERGGADAEARDRVAALDERERRVLSLLTLGRTNRQIADDLGYSVGTIKNLVEVLLAKTGAADRTQAAVLAARAGLRPADGSPAS